MNCKWCDNEINWRDKYKGHRGDGDYVNKNAILRHLLREVFPEFVFDQERFSPSWSGNGDALMSAAHLLWRFESAKTKNDCIVRDYLLEVCLNAATYAVIRNTNGDIIGLDDMAKSCHNCCRLMSHGSVIDFFPDEPEPDEKANKLNRELFCSRECSLFFHKKRTKRREKIMAEAILAESKILSFGEIQPAEYEDEN